MSRSTDSTTSTCSTRCHLADAQKHRNRWQVLASYSYMGDHPLQFVRHPVCNISIIRGVAQTVSPRHEFEKERKGENGTEGKADRQLLIARLPVGAHKNGGKSILDLIFDTSSEPGKEIIYM